LSRYSPFGFEPVVGTRYENHSLSCWNHRLGRATACRVADRAPRATVNGVQVHSVRLPGHTIAVEAHFGREDERLTLRYEGGSGATPYISGTLLAIRRVSQVRGVMRGMDDLL
jgi:dihydrodipicolinate reductase